MIFRRKNKFGKVSYDAAAEIPIIKCNTCNRDMVAGFKDKKTGAFREVASVYSDEEIAAFAAACGVESVAKKY